MSVGSTELVIERSAGPFARLLAVGAVGATALAVVSGAAGWHTAHRVLAGLALPPLLGLLLLAWMSMRGHRSLVHFEMWAIT